MPQSKHLALFTLILLLTLAGKITFGAGYTSPEMIAGASKIGAEGLIELVDQGQNPTIIDSRIASDRKLGYIPGSISLPDAETDCEALSALILQKTDPIVFYCNGPRCRRSDNAVVIARQCGYTSIYWFRGGIQEWKAGNYPIRK